MRTEASFQTDSPEWHIQKLIQRAEEWIEYQFQSLNWGHPTADPESWSEWIGQPLFWGLITVFSLWLVWQLYRLLSPHVDQWRSPLTHIRSSASRGQQGRSPQHWWQQAQALQHQGRYRDACLALYRAMLQHLHDTGQIPRQDSYTDGEYWILLQSDPAATSRRSPLASTLASAPYKVLLDAHEQIIFGNMQATEDLFLRCQQAYQEIAAP